jgi:hypothetical protein
MQNQDIHFRLSDDLKKRIEVYCTMKNISNLSEFFRVAAVRLITPDVSDEELVFESLKDLHSKMQRIEKQQDIAFSFFCSYWQMFLVYNGEIPSEEKIAATIESKERFDKIFKSFQDDLKNSPAMFESLLADYFEEQ